MYINSKQLTMMRDNKYMSNCQKDRAVKAKNLCYGDPFARGLKNNHANELS